MVEIKRQKWPAPNQKAKGKSQKAKVYSAGCADFFKTNSTRKIKCRPFAFCLLIFAF
jgi:hypothetical protein